MQKSPLQYGIIIFQSKVIPLFMQKKFLWEIPLRGINISKKISMGESH